MESRESRLGAPAHPFLARKIAGADPTWQTRLDLNAAPFLKDHLVQEHIVFPAAGYVEMALGAARALFGGAPGMIEEMDFQKALVLKEGDDAMRIQLSHHLQDSTFTIASCPGAGAETWTVNSLGKIRACPETKVPDSIAPESLDIARAQQVSSDAIYARFRELGLPYGPMFRCIETAWRRDGEVLGRIGLPASLESDSENFLIHPTVLDACFQLLLLAVPEADSAGRQALYLPVQISRLRIFAKPGAKLWCHAHLVHIGGREVVGDIRILDEAGSVLCEIEGFRCQAIQRGRASGAGDADGLVYQILWKLRPLAAFGSAAAPSPIAIPMPKVMAQVEALAERLQMDHGSGGRRYKPDTRQDPLCRYYILEAFRKMGWQLRVGEKVSVASLAKRLSVAPRHHQVFARYLSFLEEDSLLRRSGQGWIVRRAETIPDTESMWRSALDEYPGMLAELSLVRTCGRELASVLRGETDPLRLIFPDGSLAAAEHFYQDSISFRGSNLLVAETVAAVVKHLPEGRILRILEVGAGTGGMTSHVLPCLPRDRTDYVFSDLSNVFFSKAEQKFFDFPFVRCQLLDIEKPPQEQGFTPGSFDVVLASDAIHATSDLRNSLANVRSLLAPGGLLLLLEVDRPARWPDLVFALTEGWWRFTDTDVRPSYPLIAGDAWLRLFAETGLIGTRAISDRSDSAKARQAIFLGSAPASSSHAATPPELDLHRNGNPSTWLLFADRSGTADEIAALLGERGDSVVTVRAGRSYRRAGETAFEIDPASPGDMARLLAEVRASAMPAVTRVIHFWAMDSTPPSRLTPALLRDAQTVGCYSLLHFVQAVTADPSRELPRLFIVTRGAQGVVRTDTVEVAQAPVHGLARVIANEHPKFNCRAIDLTPGGTEGEARALFHELFADDGEDQVALRGPARYASRIVRTSPDLHLRHVKWGATRSSYRVEMDAPGALDRLVLRERAVRKPGPDEVTIAVQAAALNFRDVMKALGIYPGDNDDDTLLGDECAGTVTAVGRSVKHLRPGDAVMAIGPGCFASHVTTPGALVLRKPARLHAASAATIPIAFLTAWHALHHLGRMKKGDHVLIQAATGGVGLAAVQLARLAGAEIFATAGSPEKRSFLRAQGVHHVMDSRSLAFADQVREITGGKGVDIILNSLSGEAISAGLSILATGGRFLEIGKRDIYQNSKIGLRPLRNNASLFVIDLGQTMRDEPKLAGAALKRLLPMFASGKLHPLPFRVFRASQAGSAFRYMSQARHIGKIVLSMENDPVVPIPAPVVRPVHFRADASYLIIGGLGGFGMKIAEWMLRNGAGHVVLTSRSGASTEEGRNAVAALKKLGGVLVIKADVSSARDTARVFRTIARKLPPLRGVLHAATVIDDGALASQTAERFDRVMAPKATGSWNLHVCSKGLPLDFFVLFSSIATISGSPGQGSYVLANCFVESLAQHRRALGLPALVVNWGVISEVGIVARDAKLTELLAGTGLGGITPAQAAAMLGRLMQCDSTQFGVGRVDWQRLADCFSIIGTSPRYSEVVQARDTGEHGDGRSFREEILALPAAARLAAATARLKDQIAKVLRTSPAKLDTERPLNELGLDSLMGVELLNRIETILGVSLPPGNLAAGNSISKIAAQILLILPGASSGTAAAAKETPKPQVARSCLLQLREGGSQPPLFCIHPAGGLVNVYDHLVKQLPNGIPVHGIQSRALFGNTSEHTTASAMAQHYAGLIAEKQPHGAVRLLGFSFGGFMAMEIARILEKAGRTIALVGLVDADLRWTGKDYLKVEFYRRNIVEMYRTFSGELGVLKPLDAQELEKFAAQLADELVAAPQDQRVEIVLRALSAQGHTLPGLPEGMVKQYLDLFLIHTDFLGECALAVIDAPLAVWAGRQTKGKASGWRDHTAGGFSEGFIDGDHYELMCPPLVNSLAVQLAAALEKPPTRRAAKESSLVPA